MAIHQFIPFHAQFLHFTGKTFKKTHTQYHVVTLSCHSHDCVCFLHKKGVGGGQVSFPPYCPGQICLIRRLLFGRGELAQRPKARRGSAWDRSIDKDTVQAENRCSSLSEAQFGPCWNGGVVIYLGEDEGGWRVQLGKTNERRWKCRLTC